MRAKLNGSITLNSGVGPHGNHRTVKAIHGIVGRGGLTMKLGAIRIGGTMMLRMTTDGTITHGGAGSSGRMEWHAVPVTDHSGRAMALGHTRVGDRIGSTMMLRMTTRESGNHSGHGASGRMEGRALVVADHSGRAMDTTGGAEIKDIKHSPLPQSGGGGGLRNPRGQAYRKVFEGYEGLRLTVWPPSGEPAPGDPNSAEQPVPPIRLVD